MFCIKCGKEILQGAKFCKFCGQPVPERLLRLNADGDKASIREERTDDKAVDDGTTEIVNDNGATEIVVNSPILTGKRDRVEKSTNDSNSEIPGKNTDPKKDLKYMDHTIEDSHTVEKKTNGGRSSVKFTILSISIVLALAAIFFIIFINSPSQRIKRQLKLGDKYLSELKYEDAIKAYELAISIDPMNVEAYLGLTDVYMKQGDYDKAKATIERGISYIGKQNEFVDYLARVEGLIPKPDNNSESDGNKDDIRNTESESGNSSIPKQMNSESIDETSSNPTDENEDTGDDTVTNTDSYAIPPVLQDLKYSSGAIGQTAIVGDYYVGNYPLWEIYSENPIEDKGEYYEISNVEFRFYDSTNDEEDWPMTGLGYEPATLRIRKDATVWYDETMPHTVSMTAEEYYSKNKSLAPQGWNATIWTAAQLLKFDDEWYVVELSHYQQ